MTREYAIAVLARYKSGQLFRHQLRAAGRKLPPHPEFRAGVDACFEAHREEVMAWAQAAVTKIKTSVPRKRR
jgi:hypothetical protein